jgi:hypothetical protein
MASSTPRRTPFATSDISCSLAIGLGEYRDQPPEVVAVGRTDVDAT